MCRYCVCYLALTRSAWIHDVDSTFIDRYARRFFIRLHECVSSYVAFHFPQWKTTSFFLFISVELPMYFSFGRIWIAYSSDTLRFEDGENWESSWKTTRFRSWIIQKEIIIFHNDHSTEYLVKALLYCRFLMENNNDELRTSLFGTNGSYSRIYSHWSTRKTISGCCAIAALQQEYLPEASAIKGKRNDTFPPTCDTKS